MKIWRKAGKLLRNAAGKIMRSLTCCCPVLCCDWGDLTTATMVLTINGTPMSIPITLANLGFGQVIGQATFDCATDSDISFNIAFTCNPASICDDGRLFWYFQINIFSKTIPGYAITVNYQNCPEFELDSGTFVVVCDPFYIRWSGFDVPDISGSFPGTICTFPFMTTGTNVVDAVVTVP